MYSNFKLSQFLVLIAATTTSQLVKAGPCLSRPIPQPITMPTNDTKSSPEETAARKIQFWQRKQRVLSQISQECHEILNSEPVANAAGTSYEFELLAAQKFYERTLSAMDKYMVSAITGSPIWSEDSVRHSQLWAHDKLKIAGIRSFNIDALMFTSQPPYPIQNQNKASARLDCVKVLHAYCALHRHNDQIQLNNPHYILTELYKRGLPRLKQSDNHK